MLSSQCASKIATVKPSLLPIQDKHPRFYVSKLVLQLFIHLSPSLDFSHFNTASIRLLHSIAHVAESSTLVLNTYPLTERNDATFHWKQ